MFTDPLAQAVSAGVFLLKGNLPQNVKGFLDKTLKKYINIRTIVRKPVKLSNEM
jgi:hypothetical protein